MSNHDGSYIINEVLHLLDEHEIFELIGKEKVLDFLSGIRRIGLEYDCNNGEILDSIGQKLKICYTCWEYDENLDEHGTCQECKANYYKP